MNLWVNRIGQLTILSVALFFLSCNEEASVLGYRNPNSKFKVSFYEIPLESSVILRDSLRTSNYLFTSEPNRLLVGSYQDDKFGGVSASAATQFFTSVYSKIATTAVFDSVSLELQYDLYHYGPTTPTTQTFSVYKLDESLKFADRRYYFNTKNAVASELLGTKSFSINPDDFDDFAGSSTDYDTIITLRIPLSYAYGREVFAAAERWRDYATPSDSLFIKYNDFVEQFKGILIQPEVSDKVIGFSPSGQSRVLLHYHTDQDTLSLAMGINSVTGFTRITSDRSATELASITEPFTEYLTDSENRYVQSGTGILTKVDFSNFYSFIDTIPNILVNSAEILVDNVESGSLAPPKSLVLRNIDPATHRFREYKLGNARDSTDNSRYRGWFTYDYATATGPALVEDDFVYYVRGDEGSTLGYSSSRKAYSGVFTLLVQQMSIRTDDRSPLLSFALYPGSDAAATPAFTSGAKSLNRAVFPKSGIKMRIYYTKPLDIR